MTYKEAMDVLSCIFHRKIRYHFDGLLVYPIKGEIPLTENIPKVSVLSYMIWQYKMMNLTHVAEECILDIIYFSMELFCNSRVNSKWQQV